MKAIILTLIFVSCVYPKSIESHDSIENIDSTAFKLIERTSDFREYSKFILKYPESKYFGLALDKYHKTRVEYYDNVGLPNIDCSMDCAAIQIKSNQQIVYEREIINEDALQDSLFMFFCNDNNEEIKSQKKNVFDVYGKPQEISLGYVQLEYINDSCSILQSVIKEIQYSLNSYKNYLSKIWYQKEYIDIGKPEKNHLDSLLDNRLILFGWNKEHIVTPPPRPPTHKECWPDSLSESEAEEL